MSASATAAAGDDSTSAATRRELGAALVLAWLLVMARSFVYAAYEHAQFDSDQAVVGLMAKHLSEGRAFPLFFYGQPYMLAVESWLAVPMFWIAGPTVAALRASLILTNLAVATLLIVGLWRWGGLRPLYALIAALFFTLAPPLTSAELVDASGGSVEPFFYVLMLWIVRTRPLLFGAVLAIGFLQREFAIYAVPVLLAGQALSGKLLRARTVRHWLLALVAFLLVYEAVQALKPHADLMGPGTRGALLSGFSESQMANLAARTSLSVSETPERLAAAVRGQLAGLIGARTMREDLGAQGRDWMAWPLGAALIIGIGRVAVLMRRAGGAARERLALGWYLIGTGLLALLVYAVVRPVTNAPIRYVLLALFFPIGLTAVWLALEHRAVVRRAVVGTLLVWAAFSSVDNWRQLARFASGREPNEIRVLADALVARGTQVAIAPYWRAYKLTFLTREQVKIASSDFIRIEEYQRLAASDQARVLRLQEQPCAGGERVAGLFLCEGDR